MSQAPSAVAVAGTEDRDAGAAADVTLRGTTRGLEIWIAGTPTTAALSARLSELLGEAPGFFAGSQARVVIEGALPVGALACLEQVATRFDLRLVEIGPAARRMRGELVAMSPAALPPIPPIPPQIPSPAPAAAPSAAAASQGDRPQPELAEGSGRISEEAASDAAAKAASAPASADAAATAASAPATGDRAATAASALATGDAAAKAASAGGDTGLSAALAAILVAAGDRAAAAAAAAASAEDDEPGPRLVIGPVRSGRIVDHVGHLIVVGDVNPGAEVRAEGSIIVLGRLRGVAHAAIGRDAGCIIALSLQPQQLRIGRMVARAGDADRPGGGAEIAYATGETIVVERFLGRLPSGLAASM